MNLVKRLRRASARRTGAMSTFPRLAAAGSLLLALSCAGEPAENESSVAPAPGGSGSWADDLRVLEMPPSPTWTVKDIEAMESYPVQFAVNLLKRYPTAGWRAALAGVEETESPGLFRVRIIEAPPSNPAAQVITPLTVRVPLGSLKSGRYGLKVLVKEPDERQYESVQTIELEAR